MDDAQKPDAVNYDDAPVAELELEGYQYRVDPGRGSAVAISKREAGQWAWTTVSEGRWDGSRLRAKGLGHPVVAQLECALAQAMRQFRDRYE